MTQYDTPTVFAEETADLDLLAVRNFVNESMTNNNAVDWSKPDPLPDTLLPVDSFDMALLPESLQPFANDIVERVQCTPDFVGATLMAALATVIGRRVGIRPKRHDDWTEYANMWVCIIGRPGVMKSPAMSAALGPLNALAAKASKRYTEDASDFEAGAQIHAMRIDAQKKNVARVLTKDSKADVHLDEFEGPVAPALKRYIVNDATVEALLDICIENPQGICAYRDELVSLLKNLERDGQESARGFYLTGWNGNSSYTADRIGRGRNMRAEAVCLSLLGSTQPGRISEYLRAATSGGAADDGFMQRFGIIVWPDVGGEWRNIDRLPDADAKQAAYDLFDTLDAQNPLSDWGAESVIGHDGNLVEGEPPYLRLDDNAAATFLEWRSEFELHLRAGNLHPAMESHLSKYRKLVPGLALICHLADGGKGAVTNAAMMRALAWEHYLRSHAERAYGSVTIADVAGAKSLLKRIRSGDVDDLFAARDIYRKQWSMLSNPEDTNNAIAVLVDYGWLRRVNIQTAGRAKAIFEINPEVRK
ncbi:MAG: YfjI family protein [Pseudomonadota bacterium]